MLPPNSFIVSAVGPPLQARGFHKADLMQAFYTPILQMALSLKLASCQLPWCHLNGGSLNVSHFTMF